jgi:lipoyl(octanoyl) transferase
MAVTDVPAFVRSMEETIIAALAGEGVDARTRCHEGPEFTGVWVEDRKIASIGVHLSRGVTMHGFAVNVGGDLSPWDFITPCGMPGVAMTSVLEETGRADLAAFRARVVTAWNQRLLSVA